MASPFAKYQSEQVQQIAPGFVEAYGRAGAAIGQGIEKGIAAGFQGYEEAKQKHQQEIAVKAKLAPYIRNDDRITATEGMIKSGLLTKADDGTVVVSAKYDQYADKKALAKYIDFYNQTGGDGSKLSGDALIEFANRFEGEQKFISEKAASEAAKIDRELKLAQIAKAKAEAAAKAAETGLVADIMSGFGAGNEVPDSPTAGINISPYLVSKDGTGITNIVPPSAYSSPSVTTVSNTVPGVAAPATAAAPAAEPAVSPALTAGTKAAPAKDEVAKLATNLGMTKAGLIEAATRNGQTPQEYAATIESMLAVRVKGKTTEAGTAPTEEATPAAEPTAVPAAYTPVPEPGPLMTEASPDAKKAREINRLTDEQMDLNDKLQSAYGARYDSPALSQVWDKLTGGEKRELEPYRKKFVANAKRLAELKGESEAAEPAVSPALTAGTTGTPTAAPAEPPAEPAAGQAQQEQQTTAAGSPIPEKFDVAAESVVVKEKLDKINTERETVRAKYAAERNKNAATLAKQRQQALALGVVAPQKASAITSYLENSVKFQNEAEARELKALDDKEAAIERDFANYQAAATAKKGERTEARLERAAQLAENKASADVDKAKQQKMSDYPTIGIWTHLGANVKDPTKYKIPRLDPNGRIAVNEANEGFNSATSFLIRLDEVLEQRRKGDTGWRDRFRLTAENMQSYFEGELASIFGVATMRRAIVSGGNFSDADREFVKQAITYINTAAPDMSPEDLKASMKALSVFVNRMFVNKLESYNMVYDPASAKAQAKLLRDDGYDVPAQFVEKTVNQTELFYRRFGVKPPMDANKAESQMQLKEAFDLLYPKMKDKGLLPKGMKIN